MLIAELIDARFGPAERQNQSNWNHAKDFRAGGISETQVKPKLPFQIVGLLEDVFADFRNLVGRSGRCRNAKLLLPELGSFHYIEIFWLAGNYPAPFLYSHSRYNRVTAWLRYRKIRPDINALGCSLCRLQAETANHRRFAHLLHH